MIASFHEDQKAIAMAKIEDDNSKPKTFDPFELPTLPLSRSHELPPVSCVYFVLLGGEILYIGKTANLNTRWSNHAYKARFLAMDSEARIAWFHASSESFLATIETAMIGYFQPPFNQQGIPLPPEPEKLPAHNKKRHYSPDGLNQLAEIAKQARGNLSLRQFARVTGLSQAALGRIERKEVVMPEVSTLERLAPHTPYGLNELIAICKDFPVEEIRQYRIAKDVLPIINSLSRAEVQKLLYIIIDLLLPAQES